jgi:hypothetical protein
VLAGRVGCALIEGCPAQDAVLARGTVDGNYTGSGRRKPKTGVTENL